MSTAPQTPEPDPTDFDRLVGELRSTTPAPDRNAPSRQPVGNFVFVVACLAVIVPTSMVVGGWLGLVALFTSVVVAAHLLSDPHRRRRL
jgi:hypothetical protein